MTVPVLTGSCGCGVVRYEIDAPLAGAGYCHCTRCQRRTGTAAAPGGRVVPGSVRIVAGADRVHRWTPPTGLAKAFCGDCGSAVFAADPTTGDVVIVRLGGIDGDPGVRPSFHQYVAYAAPWEPLPDDGLPRHDEARP